MNEQVKIELIKEVYSVIYPNISSFYADYIGAELAYIVAAIVEDKKCELSTLSIVIQLLRAEFNSFHPVWQFIWVEPGVICAACCKEIIVYDASFCHSISGWIGHNCCVDDNPEYEEYTIEQHAI